MTTSEQQLIIDRTMAVIGADPRVASLWLSGSLGAGSGDQWSDVDFVVGVNPPATPELVADEYRGNLDAIADVVHSIRPFPRLISAVARDWSRFDLLFMADDDLARQDGSRLEPLFSHPGATHPATGRSADASAPFDVESAVREFLRIIGLGPGVVAREHFLVAIEGMHLLRNLCLDLMLAESGRSRRESSPKRLETLLTEEQRAVLGALPPLSADRESIERFQAAVWRLFIPRARSFGVLRGVPWPSDFEAATLAWVKSSQRLDLG